MKAKHLVLPIAVVLVAGALFASTPFPPNTAAVLQASQAGPADIYPNSSTQPGFANPDITQDNIADNICNKKWSTKSVRPPSSVTTKLKLQQIKDYGFNVHQTKASLIDRTTQKFNPTRCKPKSDNPACYEEDHIISLENGGNPSDPRNLYPEAYNTKVAKKIVGAHQKDKVENYVHNGICLDIPNAKFSAGPKPKHPLTLKQGQDILANDWYACYQHMLKGEDCH